MMKGGLGVDFNSFDLVRNEGWIRLDFRWFMARVGTGSGV